MTILLFNMLLALVWAFLTGSFSATTFAEGLLIGYLVLWFASPIYDGSSYFRKGRQVASFLLFFSRELLVASFRVAYEVITPDFHMRAAIIAVPIDLKSDAEITLLANLITLTPGTLTLDVSDDRTVLYVHAMYVDDVEAFRREIKDGFERRVYELFR